MYATTIKSARAGAAVDINGKTLAFIGRLPVQAGDTVYTDGKVIYGHVPIKQSRIIYNEGGVLVRGWESALAVSKTGAVKNLTETGGRILDITNWMYSKSRGVYGADKNNFEPGLNFYLDILRKNNNVFTAEYSDYDNPFGGKTCQETSGNYHDYIFYVENMYYRHDYDLGEDGFNLIVLNNWGRVASNPSILVKENGATVNEIVLSDYLFSIEKLKEMYLVYDKCQPGVHLTRYSFSTHVGDSYGPMDYVSGCCIWVSYIAVQVLNFHFNDDGTWEMIISNVAEGICYPHEIDTLVDKDYYTYYQFDMPVVYTVARVKSNGETQMLQEWTVLNSLPRNGVDAYDAQFWYNAVHHYVKDINEQDFAYFAIDYSDCRLITNLSKCTVIKDGITLADNIDLKGFYYLWTTDPSYKGAFWAGRYMRSDLRNGETSIYNYCPIPVMLSGNEFGVTRFKSKTVMQVNRNSRSYFGRLSVYKCKANVYVIALQFSFALLKKGDDLLLLADCPYNANLKMRKKKTITELKTMSDLIHSDDV